jgi:ethanolamine utilization protein EutN
MKLGRVIGNLESTVKHPCYHNLKLMIVQPLDTNSQPHGRTHPAVDTVGAGVGNLVLVVEEGKAAQALIGHNHIPIRTLIVGIVDHANAVANGAKEKNR